MKSTAKTVILTLLTSAITLEMSFAQGRGAGRGGGRPPHGPPRGGAIIPGGGDEKPPLPPLMEALDQNLDGDISADEIQEASDSLKTLDENNDGKLSQDELKPERPQGDPDDGDRPRRKRHVPPVMKVLDVDEDGEISAEEIDNAADSLAQLDHNEDGKLSKMETRPSRRFKPKQDDAD